VAVPGGAGGFLLGSVIIKKMSLKPQHQLRAMFFLAIVDLGLMLMFAVQCDSTPFADMPSHQSSQPLNV